MRAPLALSLVVLSLVVSACDGCENEVLSSSRSPSGKFDAVVFSRGCGATVGFNTQLSVLPVGKVLPEAGNAVVVEGKSALRVRWVREAALEVSQSERGRIYKQEKSVDGVEILYAR